MVQIVLSRVWWFPVLVVLFLTVACSFPYVLAVGREQVPAFIPFIRHSAAYPPQSAIFSFFITGAAVLGTVTLFLRYAVVRSRSFHTEHKLYYHRINKASLFVGLVFIIFLVYTSVNPLGFQMKTKSSWITNVLAPHHVGAVCVCFCFNIYAFIQAYMTYQQKTIFRKNVFIHAIISVCIVVSTWTAVISLSSSLKDEIKSLAENEHGLVALEYRQYSFYSTICALSEWSFTFFSLIFILSFYNDFKGMSVRIQLKPKRTVNDNVELPTLRNQDDKDSTDD